MKLRFLGLTVLLALISTQLHAECATIQDGAIVASDGSMVTTGYNDWGYNYQGHMFNGGYCDAYRGADWCLQWADVDLMMKWNDAWLSNSDCDLDNTLDRHRGYPSYIDSGAWLTNHQSGKVEVNGRMRKWTYMVKIIAVNSDDTLTDGNWYRPDGTLLGPVIWGQFAVIQQVSNDPSYGEHGILFKSPTGPGLGEGHIQ